MSLDLPIVTVIMPAFNAEKYIEEAIQSVLNQTYKKIELVIINNASSADKTEEIIHKYLDDTRIIYVKQQGKGLSNARNIGIQKSSGELVAFLDSDDLWHKEKIEKQVEYFRKNKEVFLVHTPYNILKDGRIINFKMLSEPQASCLSGNIYNRLLCGNCIGVLTAMVRKEIFDKVGYFDETLWGAEDWDLWIRIAKNHKIGFINETLATYRDVGSSMCKNVEKYEPTLYSVIKKHILNNADVPENIANEGLSYFYFRIATIYYFGGEMPKARNKIIKAIQNNPFNSQLYLLYVKTLLGKRLSFFLRKIKYNNLSGIL